MGAWRGRRCGEPGVTFTGTGPSPWSPPSAHPLSFMCLGHRYWGEKERKKKKKDKNCIFFFFSVLQITVKPFPSACPSSAWPLCPALQKKPRASQRDRAGRVSPNGSRCVPKWDAPRVPRWEALSVPIWEMPGVLRWDALCVPIWEVLSAPIWEALSVPIWEMPRVLRWDALCPQTGCTACLWRGRATCPHTGCAICPQTGHAARPLSGHAVCLRMGRAACPQPCVPSRAVPSARCWQLPAGCPQPRPHRRLGAQQRARGQPGGLGRR